MDLARLITIIRAKRGDKLTHSELRSVILDELKMLVDEARFEEQLLAIRPQSDGVMLGSTAGPWLVARRPRTRKSATARRDVRSSTLIGGR